MEDNGEILHGSGNDSKEGLEHNKHNVKLIGDDLKAEWRKHEKVREREREKYRHEEDSEDINDGSNGLHAVGVGKTHLYICSHPSCDFKCVDETDFAEHLINHDENGEDTAWVTASCPPAMEEEEEYVCIRKGCKYSTNNKDSFKVHMRSHAAARTLHACSYEGCVYTTTKKRDLDKHLRVHTGEKPFQCDLCLCRFNDQSDYVKHERECQGETSTYQCTCGLTYDDIQNYNKHRKKCLKSIGMSLEEGDGKERKRKRGEIGDREIVTQGPAQKRFKCSFEGCQYATNKNADLIKHTRLHTGEKPFRCLKCPLSFSDSSVFAKHKRKCKGTDKEDDVIKSHMIVPEEEVEYIKDHDVNMGYLYMPPDKEDELYKEVHVYDGVNIIEEQGHNYMLHEGDEDTLMIEDTDILHMSPSKDTIQSPLKHVVGLEYMSPSKDIILKSHSDERKEGVYLSPVHNPIMKSPTKQRFMSPIKEIVDTERNISPSKDILKSPVKHILKSPIKEILKSQRMNSPSKDKLKSPIKDIVQSKRMNSPIKNILKSPIKDIIGSPSKDIVPREIALSPRKSSMDVGERQNSQISTSAVIPPDYIKAMELLLPSYK